MKHSFSFGAFIGFTATCTLSLLGGRDIDNATLDALLGGLLFALIFRAVSGRYEGRVFRTSVQAVSSEGAS